MRRARLRPHGAVETTRPRPDYQDFQNNCSKLRNTALQLIFLGTTPGARAARLSLNRVDALITCTTLAEAAAQDFAQIAPAGLGGAARLSIRGPRNPGP